MSLLVVNETAKAITTRSHGETGALPGSGRTRAVSTMAPIVTARLSASATKATLGAGTRIATSRVVVAPPPAASHLPNRFGRPSSRRPQPGKTPPLTRLAITAALRGG